MTVMCYLACLAIGALILIDRAVDNWTSGLSREVTVQVRQVQDTDIEAELAKAAALLAATPGVSGVEVLDREAGAKLLEPWLGNRNLDESADPALDPRHHRCSGTARFRRAGKTLRRSR